MQQLIECGLDWFAAQLPGGEGGLYGGSGMWAGGLACSPLPAAVSIAASSILLSPEPMQVLVLPKTAAAATVAFYRSLLALSSAETQSPACGLDPSAHELCLRPSRTFLDSRLSYLSDSGFFLPFSVMEEAGGSPTSQCDGLEKTQLKLQEQAVGLCPDPGRDEAVCPCQLRCWRELLSCLHR